MEALGGIKIPLNCRDKRQRACDDITDKPVDSELEGSDDADASAELLHKRSDALALH